jgi:hypothetical protein
MVTTRRHHDGHTTHRHGRPAAPVARVPRHGRRERRRVRVAAAVLAGTVVLGVQPADAVTLGATGAESPASAGLEPATVAEPTISPPAPMATTSP